MEKRKNQKRENNLFNSADCNNDHLYYTKNFLIYFSNVDQGCYTRQDKHAYLFYYSNLDAEVCFYDF